MTTRIPSASAPVSIRSLLLAAVFLLAATGGFTPVSAQSDVRITPDVVYGHKDGMALTFDVFQPAAGANGAGVLYMVSGGWVSRWSDPGQAFERFSFLLDEGFTVFAVRHGSSPRYKVPEAFADVKRAVRYVNLHASDFGVDPARLGVWGGSAGGHLSLMLGLTEDGGNPAGEGTLERAPSRVAAVVAYYPPTDLRGWSGPSERFPALEFAAAEEESISPILHVQGEAPPTLLIHGDADDLVPVSHSVRLHEVLDEASVRTELIVLEGAGHGFRGEDAEAARRALLTWFQEHLAD